MRGVEGGRATGVLGGAGGAWVGLEGLIGLACVEVWHGKELGRVEVGWVVLRWTHVGHKIGLIMVGLRSKHVRIINHAIIISLILHDMIFLQFD